MLALAYVLVKDGTYDRSWLDRYTVGFDRFLSYLSGESDGRPKDPDWAAAICEISADRIRDLARCMRRAKTMITVSWSVQRSDHGEQPYWAAITLAAMLGGIGLPGQGISFGFGSINRQGVPTPNMPAPRLPAGTNPVKRFVPSAKVSDMLLNPGKTIDFNGEKIVYPDIKLLYFSGSNPFHHHQNTNMLLRAFHQPETIVIHEPWWTPTARHADIVLPATTTLERNDLGSGSLDRYLFAMKRALAPLHLSRNDHDIFADVADALGFRDAFTEQRSEMAWLRVMYETMRSETAKRGVDMPVFEEFWESGHVSFEVPQSPFISFAAFREDPVANPLKTPSGKIEIFSEKIHSFGYDDCPGHATWIEPAEWLGSEQARRYPLHLLTNQPRHRLHSQMDMGATSFAAKVQGREPIWIHPDDAAARNIRDGDVVRVFNDRGACLAGAVVTPNVRRQVAILSTGAWYDPLEPGNVGALDVHGSANMLTIDKGCSKLSQSPSAQTALVEIELWREPLPEISVFAPPAQRLREDSQQDRGDR
jgi:biotin/methionine sulfoxide reductase